MGLFKELAKSRVFKKTFARNPDVKITIWQASFNHFAQSKSALPIPSHGRMQHRS